MARRKQCVDETFVWLVGIDRGPNLLGRVYNLDQQVRRHCNDARGGGRRVADDWGFDDFGGISLLSSDADNGAGSRKGIIDVSTCSQQNLRERSHLFMKATAQSLPESVVLEKSRFAI